MLAPVGFGREFSLLSLPNGTPEALEIPLAIDKRLPVELWREIFILAAIVLGRSEF